ncbi:MAG: rane protein insertase YidC [Nocardioidaceae bacterium]|nr:rane protein insertase YidC [Nocardioidaceae bacterium]
MIDFLETLISPLYWIVSVILMGWHWLFSQVLDPESGWTWALSIIGLTVVVRAALIPLFVKQIKSSRNMQMLQPKVKDLQKKYGHDRERLAQETMALYKDAGTNPFASCLPILAQAPIFFALFRVISEATRDQRGLGILSQQDAIDLEQAELLGVRIADTFIGADGNALVMVVTLALVAVMTATTFTTQRQLMRKNMPESALTGPYAQQQKMLLYVLPVVFAVGGIAFPIGVLLYWSTSNLWTMCQQFYVIRNNPAPGTPAFEAKRQRDIKHGRLVEPEPEQPTTKKTTEPARRQPKKSSRSQRRKGQPRPRRQEPDSPPDPSTT